MTRIALALAAAVVLLPSAASGSVRAARTPVVLFPAFHFTKLEVTVRNQAADPACPRSGTFEDWFLNDHPSTTFSQVCQDELLTLRYDANAAKPMPQRFANQRGVKVDVLGYGTTESAPFYEPLYEALEGAGYVRDRDIRVAGYDARLTPDLGGFLARTKTLVQATYRDNGNRPLHLVGHANGPLYAQYLLTHTTRAWRDKEIPRVPPTARDLPGQGGLSPLPFIRPHVVGLTFPTTQA